MYEHFTESEKQKLQSTRTNFLSQLLKRQNSTPQSTRYEETAQSTEPSLPTMSSNKGFRFLTTKFGEGDGSDSEPEPNSGLVISFYDPEIKAEDAHGRTLNDILEWSDAKLERCHNYIQMLFPLPEGSPFNWEAPVIDRKVMEAFLEREELRANLRRSFERMLNFYGFVGVGVSKEDEETGEQEAQDKGEGEDRSEPTGKGKEKVAESEPAQKQDEETKQKPKEPAQEKSKPMPTARNVATTQRTETKVVDGDSNSHQGAQEAEPNSTTATKSSTSANTGNRTKTESSPKGYHIDLAPHWQQAFRNWAVRFDHNHLRITRILRCLRVLGLQEECEAYYSMLKYVFDHPSIRINERSMTYWQRAVRMPLHVAPDGERIMWLKKWEIEKEEAQRKQMDDVKD